MYQGIAIFDEEADLLVLAVHKPVHSIDVLLLCAAFSGSA